MGSDPHHSEATRVHHVAVGNVTSADFAQVIRATSYLTFAEMRPRATDCPEALPYMLRAGSPVPTPPHHAVDLTAGISRRPFKFGTNRRRHYGPPSSIADLSDHPVVHIA
jgi:hypothetical protein